MFKLTEEDYGMLMGNPGWSNFIEQLTKEIQQDAIDMAGGSLLSESMETTAIQYATNVGRISALIDIVNYRPGREEEPLSGEQLEEDLM